MTEPGQTRTRLLSVITIILGGAALKLSEPITLPLVVSVFLIVIAWPVQAALERRVPRCLALLGTVLVIALPVGAIVSAFAVSADQIA